MGYLDKAIADLDQVLKADPRRIDALTYRAAANRALDRLDPALVDVEKAISLNRDNGVNYGLRGALTGVGYFSPVTDLAVLAAVAACLIALGAYLFSRIQL